MEQKKALHPVKMSVEKACFYPSGICLKEVLETLKLSISSDLVLSKESIVL